jgi:hypothetical protein
MTGRLIDAYAPRFDVTQTRVVMVEAPPATVAAALQHLSLSAPAMAAIEALGMGSHVAARPAQLAARGARERVYWLLWRVFPGHLVEHRPEHIGEFAGPGHVKVIWDIAVRADAHDGAELVSTVRFIATDDAARANLFAAWGLVGAIATMLSQRALATLRGYAEQHEELAIESPAELVAS